MPFFLLRAHLMLELKIFQTLLSLLKSKEILNATLESSSSDALGLSLQNSNILIVLSASHTCEIILTVVDILHPTAIKYPVNIRWFSVITLAIFILLSKASP